MKKVIICTVALVLAASLAHAAERPPQPAKVLAEMATAYDAVDSYTATLIKQERLDSEMAPEETIELVFQKPFKVYMKWIGERFKGQEIVYVAGQYKGRLRGRRGGLLSFLPFSLQPDDPRALQGNHHPVTDVGIGRMIEIVGENCKRGLERNEVTMQTVLEYWEKMPCIQLQLEFREARPAYSCARAVVTVDRANKLPVGIEIYDQPDRLYERCEYRNLQLNVPVSSDRFRLDDQ
ncbi:MAG: DUF1571 domain-containing protein [Acidobacteriota bacterium]